jgi:hypothetical protein
MERGMTQYNSVSGVRFGLQIATAALFYAAARYKKVDGLNSAASRIGIAAVVQGVSQKVRSPLGERSKLNWLVDGISLGLSAYGMSYTDLAKRTKYLVSGSIFVSQVMISNLRPKTMLDRIEQIKTQGDCQEVYNELAPLIDGDQLATLKKIQLCDLFFLKSMSLYSSGQFKNSPALIFLKKREQLTDGLVGLEKAQSYMDFADLIFTKNIANGSLIRKIEGEIRDSLGSEGQMLVDQWLCTEGKRIKASLTERR